MAETGLPADTRACRASAELRRLKKTPLPWPQGTKGRTRQLELRVLGAHIVRLAADNVRPAALRTEPALRSHFLDFITDTLKFLAPAAASSAGDAHDERDRTLHLVCLRTLGWPDV